MPKENIIGIVKCRLWSSGYAVSERSREVDGFDLLVEGKFRVLVVRHRKNVDCFVDGDGIPTDNVAAVSFDAAQRPVVLYTRPEGPTASPREAFGLPTSKKDKHGNKKTRKEVGQEDREEVAEEDAFRPGDDEAQAA